VNDLTVVFYSCNKLPESFASKVRTQLLKAIGDTPLISVTHKPLDFGINIIVGEQQPSTWLLYKQILIGAKTANTDYVACAEDDSLVPVGDHFDYRPPLDTFAYDVNRYWIERQGFYRWRHRIVMSTCIAPRELLIDTLETRFAKFPNPPTTRDELTGWGEPSRYEWYLKLPKVKGVEFRSSQPSVTFNIKGSLGGLRRVNESDETVDSLEPWGSATKLWSDYIGA
jgi:hypothetical protein